MLVLGIETTCDETAASVVRDGNIILSNVVHSQAEMHRAYGGVYPELASRSHVDLLVPVIQESLKQADVKADAIDLIAVAKGPGLIGSLLIGLNTAKSLSLAWNRPYVGVNHVEAHLYAAMMQGDLFFPALGVVVSGGHTFLVHILDIGNYEMIGSTVDDAIGEAFDKVAAMLGLPYPGGPEIERLAKEGNRTRFPFRAGKVKNSKWNFSFSGLKTSVLYAIKGQNLQGNIDSISPKDIAASFQEAALSDIVEKTLLAVSHFGCRAVYLGGGVANNERLRELFLEKNCQLPMFWPPRGLCLDNAAMIAGLGYHQFLRKGSGDPLDLEPATRLTLSKID